MLFLSPAKLLIILVVALTVLGPETLPKVAKQIGGFWGEFKRFRQKLESEVRGSFPDLPSTEAITQAVRSPLTLLDTLADTHGADTHGVETHGAETHGADTHGADTHGADTHGAETGTAASPDRATESDQPRYTVGPSMEDPTPDSPLVLTPTLGAFDDPGLN